MKSIQEFAHVRLVRRFVSHLPFVYVGNILSILKEKNLMTLNQFDQTDDELQKHSKDSLIRIISYWKGRAAALQDELSDKEKTLYVERSDWDE
jgi:hypothetical protein